MTIEQRITVLEKYGRFTITIDGKESYAMLIGNMPHVARGHNAERAVLALYDATRNILFAECNSI